MPEIETPVYDLTYLDASQKRVAALAAELEEAQDVVKGVQARLDVANADQTSCLQAMQSNPATAQLFSSITRTVRKARSPSVKISLQEIYDMACNSEGDGKFTVKEFSTLTGLSLSAATGRMRQLKHLGAVATAGTIGRAKVYSFIEGFNDLS